MREILAILTTIGWISLLTWVIVCEYKGKYHE